MPILLMIFEYTWTIGTIYFRFFIIVSQIIGYNAMEYCFKARAQCQYISSLYWVHHYLFFVLNTLA